MSFIINLREIFEATDFGTVGFSLSGSTRAPCKLRMHVSLNVRVRARVCAVSFTDFYGMQ